MSGDFPAVLSLGANRTAWLSLTSDKLSPMNKQPKTSSSGTRVRDDIWVITLRVANIRTHQDVKITGAASNPVVGKTKATAAKHVRITAIQKDILEDFTTGVGSHRRGRQIYTTPPRIKSV